MTRLLRIRRIMGSHSARPLRGLAASLLSRTRCTVWAFLLTGQRLRVDLGSTVGRSIWLRGTYEPAVEEYLRRTLRPGDAFVDVGANVGYFSVIASPLVGSAGEVHSFEAHPEVYRLLVASIRANGLENVRPNQVAAWSTDTTCTLKAQRDPAFSFVVPSAQGGPRRAFTVRGMSLDSYVDRCVTRPVALIKIDVEGAEHHVLTGAHRLLASQAPRLVVEVQDRSLSRYGRDLSHVLELVQGYGYRGFDLCGTPLDDTRHARAVLSLQWVKNLVFERQSA